MISDIVHSELMGCVVFWNFAKDDESELLAVVTAEFCRESQHTYESSESVGSSIIATEYDELDFIYSPIEKFRVAFDQVELSSTEPREKLAVSYAFAQSCNLAVYEGRVERSIERTKAIPSSLAATGRVSLDGRQISMMIGQLFIERNEVNLHSDMLDTPDFFWDDDRWQPAYDQICSYLDTGKRVEILNKRLDIMRELLDVLSDQQERRHATKLELVVIVLIVIQVFLELVWNILLKDILKVVGQQRS